MALIRVAKVKNGDGWTHVRIYSCERCGKKIDESLPHMENENEYYCWDCSYIIGTINEKEFLSCSGVGISNAHATVREGKVIIWIGKTAPWELKNKDIRNSNRYSKWRKLVFERDSYICQHCHQVGGELNAHHIKPFSKYKELRFEISNGLTLCVDCHKDVHRRR